MNKKITFLSLIAISSMYGSTYTYSICTTSNIENAQDCVKKYMKKSVSDVYIIEDSDGKYRTTYGAFASYKAAKDFRKKLSKEMIKQGAFIKEYELNFSNAQKSKEVTYLKVLNPLKQEVGVKKVSSYNGFFLESTTKSPNVQIAQKTSAIEKSKVVDINLVQNDKPALQIETQSMPELKEIVNKSFENQEVKKELPKRLEKKEEIITKTTNLEKSSPFKVKLSLDYTMMNLDGDVKYNSGTKIDFDNDLGVSKSQGTFIPKISFVLDKHTLFTSYFSNTYKGSNTPVTNLVLNGYSFNANQNIESEISTKWYQSGYRYNFLNALVGFDIIGYESDIKVSNNTNITTIKSSHIIPTVNIDMETNFEKLNFTYGAGIGKISAVDYYQYYFGLGIDCLVIQNASWNVGYMNKKLDIKDNLYDGESKYSGGYINFVKLF